MDRALEVDQAKQRLREAADRLGEETVELLHWSPRSMLTVAAIAVTAGLLLGRNGRLSGLVSAVLPGLLRAATAGKAESQD